MWHHVTSTCSLYMPEGLVSQGYMACFDLDWTLIRPVRGIFPKSPDDFSVLSGRIDMLRDLIEKNYTLVIFTNQKNKKETALAKLNLVIKELALPVIIVVSFGEDEYRKPNVGMWNLLKDTFENIEYSFYVGDAAGRPGDFADTDKEFAGACGIPFYIPEQFFISHNSNSIAKNLQLNHKKTLIVHVGMPGSGKTTFYHTYLKGTFQHINNDTMSSPSHAKCLKLAKQYMQDGLNICLDNTNPTLAKRQEFYNLAADFGYSVVTIYFTRNGVDFNKLRPKPVPTIAFSMYFKNLVEPIESNTPGVLYHVC